MKLGRPANGSTFCRSCPSFAECAAYTTLATLPMPRGYYRLSNASYDLRRCPDFGEGSGCIGGVSADEGPCKEWLRGPYCTLCNITDASRYYSLRDSACLECVFNLTGPILVFTMLCLIAVGAGLLWARRGRTLRMPLFLARLSLRAKAKQLLGFYQVITRISDVYEIPMPEDVGRLLSVFDILNLNIAGLGVPLQCLSLGTYEQQLIFTLLAPALLAVAIVLTSGGCSIAVRCRLSSRPPPPPSPLEASGLLVALPWLLTLSFLVFPMVSSAAFRAFSCEEFDNGTWYLRADYSIECHTRRHAAAKDLALVGILLYPVGISLVYTVLLIRARRAIQTDAPTALSRALDFLVRDFDTSYYWCAIRPAVYLPSRFLAAASTSSLLGPGGSWWRRGRNSSL